MTEQPWTLPAGPLDLPFLPPSRATVEVLATRATPAVAPAGGGRGGRDKGKRPTRAPQPAPIQQVRAVISKPAAASVYDVGDLVVLFRVQAGTLRKGFQPPQNAPPRVCQGGRLARLGELLTRRAACLRPVEEHELCDVKVRALHVRGEGVPAVVLKQASKSASAFWAATATAHGSFSQSWRHRVSTLLTWASTNFIPLITALPHLLRCYEATGAAPPRSRFEGDNIAAVAPAPGPSSA